MNAVLSPVDSAIPCTSAAHTRAAGEQALQAEGLPSAIPPQIAVQTVLNDLSSVSRMPSLCDRRLKGFQECGELQLAQQIGELVLMGRLHLIGLRRQSHGTIQLDGRQSPAEAGILGLFDQQGFVRGGVTSSTRRKSSSIVPNWAISFIAVFSPMPFTPGILSVASPMSPMISTTRAGSTPKRSRHSASPNHLSFTGS